MLGERGAALAEQRVSHVARNAKRRVRQRVTDRLPQAGAAVDCRDAADAHEQRVSPVGERVEDELTDAAARCPEGVELAGPQAGQADRRRAFDDRGAVGQEQPRRPDRASERVADDSLVPLAAERPGEDHGRPLSPVRHRRLLDLDAVDSPQARGERRSSLERCEDAFEASRRRERDHPGAR